MSRFSLYCLEDGDAYFGDTIAEYFCPPPPPSPSTLSSSSSAFTSITAASAAIAGSSTGGRHPNHPHHHAANVVPPLPGVVVRGRLRLCGRAVYFEPDAVDAPILCFRYRWITASNPAAEPLTLMSLSSLANRIRDDAMKSIAGEAGDNTAGVAAEPRGGKGGGSSSAVRNQDGSSSPLTSPPTEGGGLVGGGGAAVSIWSADGDRSRGLTTTPPPLPANTEKAASTFMSQRAAGVGVGGNSNNNQNNVNAAPSTPGVGAAADGGAKATTNPFSTFSAWVSKKIATAKAVTTNSSTTASSSSFFGSRTNSTLIADPPPAPSTATTGGGATTEPLSHTSSSSCNSFASDSSGDGGGGGGGGDDNDFTPFGVATSTSAARKATRTSTGSTAAPPPPRLSSGNSRTTTAANSNSGAPIRAAMSPQRNTAAGRAASQPSSSAFEPRDDRAAAPLDGVGFDGSGVHDSLSITAAATAAVAATADTIAFICPFAICQMTAGIAHPWVTVAAAPLYPCGPAWHCFRVLFVRAPRRLVSQLNTLISVERDTVNPSSGVSVANATQLRTTAWATLHAAHDSEHPFSVTYLADPVEESIVFEASDCVRVLPMVTERCRLVITTRHFYIETFFELSAGGSQPTPAAAAAHRRGEAQEEHSERLFVGRGRRTSDLSSAGRPADPSRGDHDDDDDAGEQHHSHPNHDPSSSTGSATTSLLGLMRAVGDDEEHGVGWKITRSGGNVFRLPLSKLLWLQPRFYGVRDRALELCFLWSTEATPCKTTTTTTAKNAPPVAPSPSPPSCRMELLFAFGSDHLRNLFRSHLAKQMLSQYAATASAAPPGRGREPPLMPPPPRLSLKPSASLTFLREAWSDGRLSNFDYLMALNFAAGRSMNDLSQYPILPWVLSEYSASSPFSAGAPTLRLVSTIPPFNLNNRAVYRNLRKPMGALDERRLQMFRQRAADLMAFMADEAAADERSLQRHRGAVAASLGSDRREAERGGTTEGVATTTVNSRRLATTAAGARSAAHSTAAYLYSTNYSNPAYVTYFLVREHPEYMLVLQGGKLDQGSRIFDNVEDAWRSASSGPADVKELIPQFYVGDGSFLLANESLALGAKQEGVVVRPDVLLPTWASERAIADAASRSASMRRKETGCGDATTRDRPSAADTARGFVRTMRDALEGPIVSAELHHWIDLIFGVAQNGEAAWRADNVFHPASYRGGGYSMATAADDAGPSTAAAVVPLHRPRRGSRSRGGGAALQVVVDAVSAEEEAALEVRLKEFGSVPLQLFGSHHPPRRCASTPADRIDYRDLRVLVPTIAEDAPSDMDDHLHHLHHHPLAPTSRHIDVSSSTSSMTELGPRRVPPPPSISSHGSSSTSLPAAGDAVVLLVDDDDDDDECAATDNVTDKVATPRSSSSLGGAASVRDQLLMDAVAKKMAAAFALDDKSSRDAAAATRPLCDVILEERRGGEQPRACRQPPPRGDSDRSQNRRRRQADQGDDDDDKEEGEEEHIKTADSVRLSDAIQRAFRQLLKPLAVRTGTADESSNGSLTSTSLAEAVVNVGSLRMETTATTTLSDGRAHEPRVDNEERRRERLLLNPAEAQPGVGGGIGSLDAAIEAWALPWSSQFTQLAYLGSCRCSSSAAAVTGIVLTPVPVADVTYILRDTAKEWILVAAVCDANGGLHLIDLGHDGDDAGGGEPHPAGEGKSGDRQKGLSTEAATVDRGATAAGPTRSAGRVAKSFTCKDLYDVDRAKELTRAMAAITSVPTVAAVPPTAAVVAMSPVGALDGALVPTMENRIENVVCAMSSRRSGHQPLIASSATLVLFHRCGAATARISLLTGRMLPLAASTTAEDGRDEEEDAEMQEGGASPGCGWRTTTQTKVEAVLRVRHATSRGGAVTTRVLTCVIHRSLGGPHPSNHVPMIKAAIVWPLSPVELVGAAVVSQQGASDVLWLPGGIGDDDIRRDRQNHYHPQWQGAAASVGSAQHLLVFGGAPAGLLPGHHHDEGGPLKRGVAATTALFAVADESSSLAVHAEPRSSAARCVGEAVVVAPIAPGNSWPAAEVVLMMDDDDRSAIERHGRRRAKNDSHGSRPPKLRWRDLSPPLSRGAEWHRPDGAPGPPCPWGTLGGVADSEGVEWLHLATTTTTDDGCVNGRHEEDVSAGTAVVVMGCRAAAAAQQPSHQFYNVRIAIERSSSSDRPHHGGVVAGTDSAPSAPPMVHVTVVGGALWTGATLVELRMPYEGIDGDGSEGKGGELRQGEAPTTDGQRAAGSSATRSSPRRPTIMACAVDDGGTAAFFSSAAVPTSVVEADGGGDVAAMVTTPTSYEDVSVQVRVQSWVIAMVDDQWHVTLLRLTQLRGAGALRRPRRSDNHSSEPYLSEGGVASLPQSSQRQQQCPPVVVQKSSSWSVEPVAVIALSPPSSSSSTCAAANARPASVVLDLQLGTLLVGDTTGRLHTVRIISC